MKKYCSNCKFSNSEGLCYLHDKFVVLYDAYSNCVDWQPKELKYDAGKFDYSVIPGSWRDTILKCVSFSHEYDRESIEYIIKQYECFAINKKAGMADIIISYLVNSYHITNLEHIYKELVRIFEVGASRHGANNWQKVEPQRWINAGYRHLLALQRGEIVNYADNNVLHVFQVIWNILAVLDYKEE